MRTTILTLEPDSSTLDICKHVALTMEEFEDRCYIYQVNKKSSILYCALFINSRVSQDEAEVIYNALDLTRLYERERDYLQDEVINMLDVVYEDIYKFIQNEKYERLPKEILLLKDLFNTYL